MFIYDLALEIWSFLARQRLAVNDGGLSEGLSGDAQLTRELRG